jgi:PAS domain-containing protein
MAKTKEAQVQDKTIPLYPMEQKDSKGGISIENVANLAIQGFNEKAEVKFWNASSEQLFGISEEEAKGRRLKGVLISAEEDKNFSNLLAKLSIN